MDLVKEYIAPLAEPICFASVRTLCNADDPYTIQLTSDSADDGGIILPDDEFGNEDDNILLPEHPL